MPRLMSRAFPAIFEISLCRKELRALFILNPPVELPSAIYIPVTSMVTASLPRSSGLMAVSWSCTEASSGAERVKASPRFSSRWLRAIPTSKLTMRGLCPSSPTVARTRSVAVILSWGFITLPVHST